MDLYKDLGSLVAVLQSVGPIGLLVYIYWSDQRLIRKIQDDSKKDTEEARQQYKDNVLLVKGYETLVKSYEAIVKSLTDIVMLNTQHMTTMERMIEDNQFCPMVRRKEVVTKTIETENRR